MAKSMKGVTCITRNGAAYWYARVDGRRVYCGEGAKGRKLAEAARSKHVTRKYENREVDAGLKVRRADLRTVTELANWYMTLPTVQEQRSYRRKTEAVAHILKHFGTMPLGHVDADALEQYRAKRKRENVSHSTVNLETQILGAMFHLAARRKKILADQVPGEFPQVEENNPRPIVTDAQYKRLLEASDQDLRDLLTCAYESAMRSGEICHLTARQVHLDTPHISGMVLDYIDLGIFDTKTGARRTVPVSGALKAIFERRLMGLSPSEHVFSYVGREGHRRTWTTAIISNRFADTCRSLGVPFGDGELNEKGERVGLVFHCFRHTRTTKWVEMGFSDEIVRRATGHKSLDAYQQYVKLDPAAVMMLVEKRHTNDIKSPQILENRV